MNDMRDAGFGGENRTTQHDAFTSSSSSGASDENVGWTTSGDSADGGEARTTAERMLSQLQGMIDSQATQAAPVVRQIGAKAAELAAVAADRAGPIAHKAADATADASGKLAERSRVWAADLRRSEASGGTSDSPDAGSFADAGTGYAGTQGTSSGGVSTDDPAEGRRDISIE